MGQVPLYYNQKPTSRHQYVDESSKPLFAFGHGLSYTQFTYNTMSITPAQISPTGTATVRVQITNTGTAEGTEVAQLYVRDVVSSVTTPAKALKGFARITLKPGENGTVEFKVGAEALALWNRQMEHVVEPGAFDIMVGSASDDIRQNGKLIVQ
jgi:beta-glucosidase